MNEFEKKSFDFIQNERELEFAIFCVENLAEKTGVPAPEMFKLLSEQSQFLQNYIVPNFEILHTQSKEYILEDLLAAMRQKGILK